MNKTTPMTSRTEGLHASTAAGAHPGETQRQGVATAGASPSAQIIALPELHPLPGDGDAAAHDKAQAPLVSSWNPLHSIRTTLQACVGSATVTVGELLAAKQHQVLRLDRTVEQSIDLLIDGKVVARGQLVAVDGQFAVRITEAPVGLGLAAER